MEDGETICDFIRAGVIGSRLQHFHDGETVFQPGDSADDLFLVETGEIRLFHSGNKSEQILLAILGPGDLFGLSSLGYAIVYGKRAISFGNSKTLAASAKRLRDALLCRGDMAVQLIDILSLQLHDAWSERGQRFSQDCRFRFVKKLIEFAGSPAALPVSSGVELRMTHSQIAQAVGAARETISICMMELRNENLVETKRNRVIYDPDRLRQAYPDSQPIPESASTPKSTIAV
jgi:CRP-like cAMP-binding protein